MPRFKCERIYNRVMILDGREEVMSITPPYTLADAERYVALLNEGDRVASLCREALATESTSS